MKRSTQIGLCTLVACAALAGGYLNCAASPPQVAAGERPAGWATPIAVKTVPNFHQVSDTLFRGAQPPSSGFKALHRRGITTVINLRELHTDDDEIGDLPLKKVHIPISTTKLGHDDVVAFLKAATDPANQPVFVHCRHGSDRTGTMCAMYRIVIEGWDREEAIREMTTGNMGFHAIFENLPEYVRTADLDKLRADAGLNQ